MQNTPNDWGFSTLGDVILDKPQYGLTARSSTKINNTVYIRISDITDEGQLKPENLHYVNLNSDEVGKYRLHENDFLIARSGSVGRVYLHHALEKPAVFASYLIRFRLDTQKVLPKFVFYWGLSPDFNREIEARKKIVAQPNINAKDYCKFRLPVPRLQTQRRIVSVLERASNLKKRREQSNQLTNKIIQSVFLKMFGDPANNPKGWEIVELGEVIHELRYGTSVKCTSMPNGGIPVLRIPNIVRGLIELDGLKFSKLSDPDLTRYGLKDGDLLFVRTNGNREYVGRCAVFHEKGGPYAFASYLIRARLQQKRLNPDFVAVLLSFSASRNQLFLRARTSAGQYNINTEGIRSIKIVVPPLSLQEKFVLVLSNYAKLRRRQQESESEINLLFQSLMHKAFRGELVS
jgi:type I restriction enzyme S subunit